MSYYRHPLRVNLNFRWLSAFLVFTLLLSGCTVNVYVNDPSGELAQVIVDEAESNAAAAQDEEHSEDEEAAEGQGGRLLVADSATGLLQVIDLTQNAVIAEFEVAGPASLYTTESGRLAGVVQGDANLVNFVDSGVWVEDHVDHVHNRLRDPALLPFQLEGSALGTEVPVHFVSHHGWVTVHFDGNSETGVDSKNILVREADLLAEAPTPLEFVTASQHGVSVMAHDGRIVLSDPAAEAGELPSGFVVYDEAGTELQRFHDVNDPSASCIGMHGEGVVGNHYLFGCHQDDGGVLVLTQDEATGEFTSSKITYPDNRRTSVLATSEHQPFAVGQYGAYPDYNGLVRIDPTLTAIPAEAVVELPAKQCGFAFERSHGEQVVVLTEDGYVRVFDPLTWTELSNLQIAEPFVCFGEEAVPSLAVGENAAYVTLPAAGEVVEITLPTAAISRTFAVEGTPGSVAVFGWWHPLRGGSESATQDEQAHADQAEFTDLSAWDGSWISADAFLDDPTVEAVYAAIDAAAEQGEGAGRQLMETMLQTDFTTIDVAGNTVTYGDGTNTIACDYAYVGPRDSAFGEYAIVWHQAELSAGDEGCETYHYLLLMEAHAGDAGDLVHWHGRYGDTSFDALIDDPVLALWWPSLMPSEATAEALAAGWVGSAESFAAMLEMEPATALEASEAQGEAATLVVADVRDGGLYAYSIPDWQPVAEFPDLTLADHPGYLVLPDGRVLFTTHDHEFVVLALAGAASSIAARIPLPGSAIHFAVDPTLSFAVVSTMRDEEAGVGENTLTQIDLTTYTAASIPVSSGEPGVLISDEAVLHRDGGEIGRLGAFPLANFATNDGTAASYMDIGAFGHGEGLVNNHAYVATDDGIDVVQVEGTELTHTALIPWNVSGREGGRGYYMRADAHGNLWSYLRIVQNPDADASWANWQEWGNDGYLINTASNEAVRFDLGPGLVYRMSLSQSYALYSRLHPDGDQAILVDADPTSAEFAEIVATIDLPPTSDAPVAGVEPWDAAGQRITAITPDGQWGFVSSGGDGMVHVIDTAAQTIVGQIEVPVSLTGGGYLLVVQPGQAVVDSLGR